VLTPVGSQVADTLHSRDHASMKTGE